MIRLENLILVRIVFFTTLLFKKSKILDTINHGISFSSSDIILEV